MGIETGRKIRMAMIEAGLNQKVLGERLNITGSAVSRWVTGIGDPTLSSLKKIAKLTNKPLSYFLDAAETIVNTGNSSVVGKHQNVNYDGSLMNIMNTKLDLVLEKLTKQDLILEKLTKK